jgi:hypothetical protein
LNTYTVPQKNGQKNEKKKAPIFCLEAPIFSLDLLSGDSTRLDHSPS